MRPVRGIAAEVMPSGRHAGWKPNRWIAASLSLLIIAPLGLLYAVRPRLAAGYLAALLLIVANAMTAWFPARLSPSDTIVIVLALYVVAAVHAGWIAAHASEMERRPWFASFTGLAAIVVLPLASIWLFRTFAIDTYRVASQSMLPTMSPGTIVAVRKWGYGNYTFRGMTLLRTDIDAALERGDLLVFEFPHDRNQPFVARLIGLPGDHVALRNKRLSVNGTLLTAAIVGRQDDLEILQESGYRIAIRPEVPAREPEYEEVVESGHLLLLGDNRDVANDSRAFGVVPLDHVIGKVIAVLAEPRSP